MTEEVTEELGDITLSQAFSHVMLSNEEAAGILNKMAEMFTDIDPDIREAFISAANEVASGVDTP